jgi:capsular polysaccharide biosynthesis protein
VNFIETLRGLWRRWYIVIPGLLLAVAVAFTAWFVVKPGYERTASQLLLPGSQSIPVDSNPFLYLGGLSNAADVIVRAVGSANVLSEVADTYPGAEVEVTRDVSTSGPVILIKVTGSSDAEAEAVLSLLVDRTAEVLAALQDEEQIAANDRITVVQISSDDHSLLQQKNRLLAVGVGGVAVAALVLVTAGLVDGLMLQRRRRPKGGGDAIDADEDADEDEDRNTDAAPPSWPDADDATGDEPEPDRVEDDSAKVGTSPIRRR